VLDLMIPQGPNPGLNLLGANQHLLTAIWGLFLLAGLDIRTRVARPRPRP
jgi:simple sugar transport system permease protein